MKWQREAKEREAQDRIRAEADRKREEALSQREEELREAEKQRKAAREAYRKDPADLSPLTFYLAYLIDHQLLCEAYRLTRTEEFAEQVLQARRQEEQTALRALTETSLTTPDPAALPRPRQGGIITFWSYGT